MHKLEQNCTHTHKHTHKTHKVSQVQMQYNFSKFLACMCNSVVFSSKVGRENLKKKRVWRQFCEWYLWLCLARCCQPAVAGGIIYAGLRGELSTHLALQALFTQSSLVLKPLLQAFPFPSTLAEVTLHSLSQACVFVYSSCGRWVFPPLLWCFPPSTTLTSFPTPDCWVHAPASAGASLASRGLFIYSSGKDSLPQIFSTQCTPPSFPCVFIVLFAYSSVSLFSPGGGRSVQGAMLLCSRVVCGSTTAPLSSPCLCLPKLSGHGRLAAQGPSWFLHLT
jgi:hypothetical protein